ncbi:mannose-6-phosphate isomerase [Methylomarinovum caldicuralii]|uniref:mannose-6-phosphate isomerase n=1 Tax=Methylomarinovum caldicuralii TaxID=438856 RepID=A0AAU9BQI8_9GAMM|nr:mannose-6-phosphate isomerase, class I [Methylomarinovum caldicuralii]BCX80711.1 mannose-6-phosphate isomerase [Methylomarinovum caldicuralii]
MMQDRIERAIAAFCRDPAPLPLFCGVQHYAWGDPDYIPRLLGIPNPERKPFAELWIGAHPDLPAQAVIDGVKVPLDRLLAAAPTQLLGELADKYHGQLPFLLKILAAARPLSIQVHPNKRQAEAGYAREEAQGIPLDSPRRNYRDRNHKPELLSALTPFYALKGFRPEAEIEAELARIPEWAGLLRQLRECGLKRFYEALMTLPQAEVDALLGPVLQRLRGEGPWSKEQREFWFLWADELYSQAGRHDRGLFSIFLLNFLRLRPGEAIFQAAGELHAYLQGVGVEVMANSNNVLRGGLTPKHVDVPALLEIVRFEGRPAEILRPVSHGVEAVYEAPVDEFRLSRIELAGGDVFDASGALRLGIVLEGRCRIAWRRGQIPLRRGQSYLIPHGVSCRFEAVEPVTIYQGACRR